MATLYNVNKTFQGVNGYGTHFTDQSYTVTLAANTNTTVTTPSNASMGFAGAQTNPTFIAVFHYQQTTAVDVWVALNTAATAPASGSFALTQSTLNPKAKVVKAGDVINCLCVAGGNMTIEFFSTQDN